MKKLINQPKKQMLLLQGKIQTNRKCLLLVVAVVRGYIHDQVQAMVKLYQLKSDDGMKAIAQTTTEK
jgi:hypothetical protein